MRSKFSRRDFLKLGGAALLAAAFSDPHFARAAEPPAPPTIYHGSLRYPRLALTYDDCYLVTRLHMLEKSLDDNPQARITLFPVGEALLNNENKDPGIWKRFSARGHEFGYHSFDHTNLGVFSFQKVLEDYDRWQAALDQVLGTQPEVRFARPPFGVMSYPFLNMCLERGLVATLWSTGFGGPLETGVHAAERALNGDIVLMHTRQQPGQEDMATTAKVLPLLAARGMECVTLARLYDDLLREQNNSAGCDVGSGTSLHRTCIDE